MNHPAIPAWATLIAVHLVDVVIMSRGKSPITHVLRSKPGKVFTLLLAGHVADVLGPADPFRALSKAAEVLVPRPRLP